MRKLIAALTLISTQAFAFDVVGEWEIVEWSDSAAHSESVIMTFDPSGSLTTSTTVPGNAPKIELTKYQVLGPTLEITNEREEVSKHPLEVVENGLKVGVPFGYFVVARTPNHSLQARLP